MYFFFAFFGVSNTDRLTLEDKVSNLQIMSTKKHIIKLTDDYWHSYVRSAPRNYSVIVMFTLLSQGSKCQFCK